MTWAEAVDAYARQVAEEWGPWSAEEIELLNRVMAPAIRAVRQRRAQNAGPVQEAA
ncbi:hypothetical protein AB0I81_22400 [Nonomuraea sp. NPDC050404]|uniref:hypothetical protein n=1 Tax=Nonomuraea sp. NPDC050404 TaxID=3155783 RepID=UPI003400AD3B